MPNQVYGIDLSHNNGTVDFSKVKAANPANSFVFVKATQGVGYVDPMCSAHATGAVAAGLRLGYYHFASLNNNVNPAQDAISEANWFDKTMKTMPKATLPPVLDIETNKSNLTPLQVQEWISAFMTQMKSLGYPVVIIYSYGPFFNANLPANHPFGSIPLWLAQYTSAAAPKLPIGWNSYLIWQYSGSGKVNGVSTDCDMNKADSSFLA